MIKYNSEEYSIREERAKRVKKIKEEKAKKIKEAQPKEKKCYDIRQEVLAPVVVFYKVWAHSPQEAAEMVERKKVLPSRIEPPNLIKSITSKIHVYISGTINKVFSKQK